MRNVERVKWRVNAAQFQCWKQHVRGVFTTTCYTNWRSSSSSSEMHISIKHDVINRHTSPGWVLQDYHDCVWQFQHHWHHGVGVVETSLTMFCWTGTTTTTERTNWRQTGGHTDYRCWWRSILLMVCCCVILSKNNITIIIIIIIIIRSYFYNTTELRPQVYCCRALPLVITAKSTTTTTITMFGLASTGHWTLITDYFMELILYQETSLNCWSTTAHIVHYTHLWLTYLFIYDLLTYLLTYHHSSWLEQKARQTTKQLAEWRTTQRTRGLDSEGWGTQQSTVDYVFSWWRWCFDRPLCHPTVSKHWINLIN